ncbi:hypothetical protein ACU686_18215 [Yinghuangia aomiensis]
MSRAGASAADTKAPEVAAGEPLAEWEPQQLKGEKAEARRRAGRRGRREAAPATEAAEAEPVAEAAAEAEVQGARRDREGRRVRAVLTP